MGEKRKPRDTNRLFWVAFFDPQPCAGRQARVTPTEIVLCSRDKASIRRCQGMIEIKKLKCR